MQLSTAMYSQYGKASGQQGGRWRRDTGGSMHSSSYVQSGSNQGWSFGAGSSSYRDYGRGDGSSVGGYQSSSDSMQSRSSTWPNTSNQVNPNPYQKQPTEQNDDDSEFMRELQLRLASELQQDEQAEVSKILKVMNIVEKVKADIDKSRNPVSDQSIGMPIATVLTSPYGMSGMSNPRGNPTMAGMGATGAMPNMGFPASQSYYTSSHMRNFGSNVGNGSGGYQRSPRGRMFEDRYRYSDRQGGFKKGNNSQSYQDNVQPQKLPTNKRQAKIMKLRLLAKFLKAAKPDIQPMNRLESAMSKCNKAHKLTLQLNCDQQTYLDSDQKPMMTFSVKLDDIFLAKAEGKGLKRVRRECYTNIIEMLTQMTPEKILKKQKDAKTKPAQDVVPAAAAPAAAAAAAPASSPKSASVASSISVKTEKTGQPLELPKDERQAKLMKLSLLTKYLKTAKADIQPIHRLDSAIAKCKNIHKLDLKLNCDQEAYRDPKNKSMMTFVVKLDDIFLTRADGRALKHIRKQCFTYIVDVLAQMSPEEILNQKDEMPQQAQDDVDVAAALGTQTENPDSSTSISTPDVPVNPEEFPNLLQLYEHMTSLKSSNTGKTPAENVEDALLTLDIDYDYSDEERKRASGAPWFIGILKVDNVVIGTGSGPCKEKAKKKAYVKAFEKDFQALARGIAFMEKDLLPGSEILTEAHYDLPNIATEGNIQKMIEKLSQIEEGSTKSLQVTMDEAAKKSGLVLMRVCKLKPGTPGLHQCEIYLDNIFITIGEASNHNEARKKAYEEGLVVLTSSNSNVIYNDFKRVSTEDSVNVREVVEVTSSRNIRTVFFNQARKAINRRRTILKAKDQEMSFNTSDISEIIIMENMTYSSQQYQRAMEILKSSAIMNMMILEGKITSLGTNYKCSLFMQGERIVSCVAPTKQKATNKAGAIALFKLYQTRPTIRISRVEDQDKWISFESLIPQAEELDVEIENMPDIVPANQHDTSDTAERLDESMETGHPDATQEPQQDDTKATAAEEADYLNGTDDHQKMTPGGTQATAENSEITEMDTGTESQDDSKKKFRKRVLKVIEGMLKDFTQKACIEELSFGGGFEKRDLTLILKVARGMKLSAVHKRKNNTEYVVVYQTLEPKVMYGILEEMGGTCSRYSIIPKEELPSPNDVPMHEETAESAPKKNRKRKHEGGQGNQPTQQVQVKEECDETAMDNELSTEQDKMETSCKQKK